MLLSKHTYISLHSAKIACVKTIEKIFTHIFEKDRKCKLTLHFLVMYVSLMKDATPPIFLQNESEKL